MEQAAIMARINELKMYRERLITEGNLEIARVMGAIGELERLLEQAAAQPMSDEQGAA